MPATAAASESRSLAGFPSPAAVTVAALTTRGWAAGPTARVRSKAALSAGAMAKA